MPRSLSLCTFAAALCAALAPGPVAPVGTAAPVPKHLMPKEPVFNFPTTVGTKWVYAVGDSERTEVITNAEVKDGVTVVTIANEGADGKLTTRHELSIGPNEWCLYSESGHKYDPPWTFLRFPHGKEHKIEIATSRPDFKEKITSETIQAAVTEEVKVPAGTFTAVKIDTAFQIGPGGGRLTLTAWYAPGIGMVKRHDPPTTVLKSFTLGKGKN